MWNRIDLLFKTVKEKKFGNNAINDSSAGERMTRRYEGLIGAVDKMQDSIDRDIQDLEYQRKRVEQSEGQLEAQLRQAKINMINERVKSKQEKLNEMLATKADVEAKIANLKERDAKKAAADAKVAAREEAQAAAVKAEAPVAEVKEDAPAAPVAEVKEEVQAVVETPAVAEVKSETSEATTNVETEVTEEVAA